MASPPAQSLVPAGHWGSEMNQPDSSPGGNPSQSVNKGHTVHREMTWEWDRKDFLSEVSVVLWVKHSFVKIIIQVSERDEEFGEHRTRKAASEVNVIINTRTAGSCCQKTRIQKG